MNGNLILPSLISFILGCCLAFGYYLNNAQASSPLEQIRKEMEDYLVKKGYLLNDEPASKSQFENKGALSQ